MQQAVDGLEIDQELKDELWSYLTQAAVAMINAAE
jgi:truncated hemoglobin YjbI